MIFSDSTLSSPNLPSRLFIFLFDASTSYSKSRAVLSRSLSSLFLALRAISSLSRYWLINATLFSYYAIFLVILVTSLSWVSYSWFFFSAYSRCFNYKSSRLFILLNSPSMDLPRV
jgi:hypothetical protein